MSVEEKDDFEIEQILCELLGNNWYVSPSDDRNPTGGWEFGEHNLNCPEKEIELPRYTSDWGVMGPVIVDLGISTVKNPDENIWSALVVTYFDHNEIEANNYYEDKNPLRAAALVAIKVLEAKK